MLITQFIEVKESENTKYFAFSQSDSATFVHCDPQGRSLLVDPKGHKPTLTSKVHSLQESVPGFNTRVLLSELSHMLEAGDGEDEVQAKFKTLLKFCTASFESVREDDLNLLREIPAKAIHKVMSNLSLKAKYWPTYTTNDFAARIRVWRASRGEDVAFCDMVDGIAESYVEWALSDDAPEDLDLGPNLTKYRDANFSSLSEEEAAHRVAELDSSDSIYDGKLGQFAESTVRDLIAALEEGIPVATWIALSVEDKRAVAFQTLDSALTMSEARERAQRIANSNQ